MEMIKNILEGNIPNGKVLEIFGNGLTEIFKKCRELFEKQ